MKELSKKEVELVNGGFSLVEFGVMAVGGGLVANYLYESAGGAEGINRAVSNFFSGWGWGSSSRGREPGYNPCAR